MLLVPPACYVNHCCDPNSIVQYFDGVRWDVARRDIRAGEEITHDYCVDGFGETVWHCHCGSARCRKTIHSDFFHLPQPLQMEYLPYLSDLYRQVFRERVEELKRSVRLPI